MSPSIDNESADVGGAKKPRFSRTIFGAAGVICLVLAFVYIAVRGWEEVQNPYIAALIRCGLVLIALWLAMPDLRSVSRHMPYMMIVAMIILLAVIIARPKLLPMMAIIVFAILVINVTFRTFRQNKD